MGSKHGDASSASVGDDLNSRAPPDHTSDPSCGHSAPFDIRSFVLNSTHSGAGPGYSSALSSSHGFQYPMSKRRTSRFRAFTNPSTLPSIVLLALSALNLTVVFHYWRGRPQRFTLPADHYSLFCECDSSTSDRVEFWGLGSDRFKRSGDMITLRSTTTTSTHSKPSLLPLKSHHITNWAASGIPNGSPWPGKHSATFVTEYPLLHE